jgi:hypothetical protein
MDTEQSKQGRRIWGIVAFVLLVVVLTLIRVFHLY